MVLSLVFVLFSVSSFAQTKKLRQLGRYKFAIINDDVSAGEVMKTLLETYREDIKYGFDLSGHSDLFLPFVDQIEQYAFKEKELAIGEKMIWMVYRSGGDIKIVRDLEWAGTKPVPVFSSHVVKDNKRYHFIVPKPCGNIALQKVEDIDADVASKGIEPPSSAEPSQAQQKQEFEIKRAKIYEEIYDLLNETDLYCSFMVMDEEKPVMQIVGADREHEKDMFNDGDIVYINRGEVDGLESGQLFLIFHVEKKIPGYGPMAFKRGRARIIHLSQNKASAVIEKACGEVRLGYSLVPFEVKEGVMGKDLGFADIPPFEVKGIKGSFIYLQTDYNQVGTGQWALIDLGEDDGIQLGQQLVAFRIVEEGAPLQIFGNVVVIDVQKSTSTIKVLSCRDPIQIGDSVMEHPNQ